MYFFLIQQGAAFRDKMKTEPNDNHEYKKNEKPERPQTAGFQLII